MFFGFNSPNLHLIEDSAPWRAPLAFEQEDALASLSMLNMSVSRIYTLAIASDSKTAFQYHVSSAFDTAANVSWTVISGTSDPVLYANTQLFEALDAALAIASKNSMKLIIPLIDQYAWWGGIPAFAAIHNATSSAFFSDPAVVKNFHAVISFLVKRNNSISGLEYRYDPAVYAWETGNELSGVNLANWTIEVARLLKYELNVSQPVFDGSYGSLYGWDESVLTEPAIDGFTGHYYMLSPSTQLITGVSLSVAFLVIPLIALVAFFFVERRTKRKFPSRVIPKYKSLAAKIFLFAVSVCAAISLGILVSRFDSSYQNYAGRFEADHDLVVTNHQKLFFVGEFGLAPLPVLEQLLAAVSTSKALGALIWSQRFRSRDGGFYTHYEGDSYYSYHLPGNFSSVAAKFASSDENSVVDLVKSYSLGSNRQIAAPTIVPKFTTPIVSSANSVNVSLAWQGSAGAQYYTLERAEGTLAANRTSSVAFSVLSNNISDAVISGSSLFVDSNVTAGSVYWYRVCAENSSGRSNYSETLVVYL